MGGSVAAAHEARTLRMPAQAHRICCTRYTNLWGMGLELVDGEEQQRCLLCFWMGFAFKIGLGGLLVNRKITKYCAALYVPSYALSWYILS